MDNNSWTFGNQIPGQYQYYQSHESGCATLFSSPTLALPDHIHHEFLDTWDNISSPPSPPVFREGGYTLPPSGHGYDGEVKFTDSPAPLLSHAPLRECLHSGRGAHSGRLEALELRHPRRWEKFTIRSLNSINPGECASESQVGSASESTVRDGFGERLRPVSELPDRFRGAFKFGVFNAIQSTCFDQVLRSEENLVISAPTGSGKTVLFELGMIRMLTQTSDDARAAKCVYVAPTKALCTEKYNEWTAKFGGLGVKCCELTGDTLLLGRGVWGDAKSSHIIVTTAEKWDSLTRNWMDHSRILSQIKLFLMDEIHILNESRGSTLEVIVSRMKARGSGIRFLLISATVPNVEDVARWIGSSDGSGQPARIFQFGEEFRPCKLTKFVYGVAKPKGQNDFAYARTLDLRLFSVLQQHSTNKPILVFCPTRKGTLDTAKQLTKDYERAMKGKKKLPWLPPPRINQNFHDKDLTALASVGIAVHHAGLNSDDRKTVEDLYLQKALRVLVSTSTLAVGVNLPAQMVVIKGVKLYQNGEMKEYSDLDVVQMMGRAGRPQFDDEGIAIILCEPELEHKYRTLTQGNTTLESSLHQNLAEHINSEIGLGTISTVENAKEWLRHSFLFRRIQKNPHHYDIGKYEKQTWAEKIDEIVMQSILSLRDTQLVMYIEKDGRLSSTEYGDVMSKFYIRQATMRAILKLPASINMRDILELVSTSEEVSDLKLRSGEKQMYEKIRRHSDIRFPPKKVSGTSDKVLLLIQAILSGLPLNSPEFKPTEGQPFLEAISIFRHATRIVTALAEVAIINRSGGHLKYALELVRCFNAKAWEDRPLVLRQIEHIGEKSVKVLAENGVNSIEKLLLTSPLRIEELLNRRPPFGLEVLAAANEFPRYYLDIKELKSTHSNGTSPVEVEFVVQCGVILSNSAPLRAKKPKRGRTEMTTLFILTSDMVFIDFRRIATKALNEKKEFTLTAQLMKPSQSINVHIASERYAGVTLSRTLVTSIPPDKYPTPETRPLTSIEMDLQGLEDIPDFWNIDLDDDNEEKAMDSKALECSKHRIASENLQKNPQVVQGPRKRPDGKYECNHSCRNKFKCRHLCCQEGMLEAPRALKKKRQENAHNPNDYPPSLVSIEAKSPQDEQEQEAGGWERSTKPLAKLCEGANTTRECFPGSCPESADASKRPPRGKVAPNFDLKFTTLKRSLSTTSSSISTDVCRDAPPLTPEVQEQGKTEPGTGVQVGGCRIPSSKRRRTDAAASTLGSLPSQKMAILHKNPQSPANQAQRLFLPGPDDEDAVDYCDRPLTFGDRISHLDESYFAAPDHVSLCDWNSTRSANSNQQLGDDAGRAISTHPPFTHQTIPCDSDSITTILKSARSSAQSALKRNNSYALSPSRISGFIRRSRPYSSAVNPTVNPVGLNSRGRNGPENDMDSDIPVGSDDPLAEFDRWLASGAVVIIPD